MDTRFRFQNTRKMKLWRRSYDLNDPEFSWTSDIFGLLTRSFRGGILKLVALFAQYVSTQHWSKPGLSSNLSQYFYRMINVQELRAGNHIMQKVNNRIINVKCNFEHFELLSKGGKDIFPILLKPELLEKIRLYRKQGLSSFARCKGVQTVIACYR